MMGPQEILNYWLDDIGPKGWYDASDALDAEIRQKFETTWQAACDGQFSHWMTCPSGALAYIILMDQFPRNMFRGTAQAFASDRAALAAAKRCIDKGWDMKTDEPARQFFYMPLMHSESLCDQERCVRLMCERMPEGRSGNLLHARAHREVIRQFGRFPYRNAALARATTEDELAYVEKGGYGHTMRELQASAAA